MNKDSFVYLITDNSKIDFNELVYKVESAMNGGIKYIQYRNKNASSILMYKEGIVLKELCKKYNVPFIINDRVDIALALEADGVHIGAEDLPINIVRELMPHKIIGVTAKSLKQAHDAFEYGADYLGVGALFQSSTKPEAMSMSLDVLKNIRNSIDIKLFGIGGISIENLNSDIIRHIDGVALSSAILQSNNPENYTKRINEMFLL